MNSELTIKNALAPLAKDARDFAVGAIFDLPDPKDLPITFEVGNPVIKNQYESDFCGSFACDTISELQEENAVFAPEWAFAVAKMQSGDVDEWGSDLRTQCKVRKNYGSLPLQNSPFTLATKSPDFLRRIQNWPKEAFQYAQKYRKQSFFSPKGPYDHYDNIRASMWHFRDKKCGVVIGVMWSYPISKVVIDKAYNGGFGHAMAVIGWNEIGLIVQNSAGPQAGENGRHYITRDVINKYVEKFGAFMFIDMPKEEAQWHMENGVRFGDNWVVQFYKVIKNIFYAIYIRATGGNV